MNSASLTGSGSYANSAFAGSAWTFDSPTGVAADAFGNIYVTEPRIGSVRTILQSGQVVAAAQAKTFTAPAGITIGETGKAVVADSLSPARELGYGAPRITAIVPDKLSNRGGERVTITGSNFSPETLIVIG